MITLTDKNGYVLYPGDKVHNKYGYDLIVSEDENGHLYGKLICEPGDSCENIPYTLVSDELTKYIPKRRFNVGSIQMNYNTNGFPKGLILKRKLTVKECRYILRELLGIDVEDRDCFDFQDEYTEYNKELCQSVNNWLIGEYDDGVIANYAYDCSDEQLGLMNMIPIIMYLKKKKAI